MVRAAAKNYDDVTVITSIEYYDDLINELKKIKDQLHLNLEKKMSQNAFSETAYYDLLISNYLNQTAKINFPQKKIIIGNLFKN